MYLGLRAGNEWFKSRFIYRGITSDRKYLDESLFNKYNPVLFSLSAISLTSLREFSMYLHLSYGVALRRFAPYEGPKKDFRAQIAFGVHYNLR